MRAARDGESAEGVDAGAVTAVDHTHQSLRVRIEFGLTPRQYIWKGGSTGGQDGCFAYGEAEWMNGETWIKTKENTERFHEGRGPAGAHNPIVICEG